jgi:hypothetical protein
MNLRTFSAISAVSMLVLGGCVIVGTTPNGGGNGGNGGEVTTGGNGGAGVGSTSSSSGGGAGGGTGGTGGAPACAKTCAEAITEGVAVCDSSPASLDLYNALAACSCDRAANDPMPGCKDLCGDNLCMAGGTPSADCGKCLQSGNCMAEFGACSSDL